MIFLHETRELHKAVMLHTRPGTYRDELVAIIVNMEKARIEEVAREQKNRRSMRIGEQMDQLPMKEFLRMEKHTGGVVKGELDMLIAGDGTGKSHMNTSLKWKVREAQERVGM